MRCGAMSERARPHCLFITRKTFPFHTLEPINVRYVAYPVALIWFTPAELGQCYYDDNGALP
jgi:hypothetical protein